MAEKREVFTILEDDTSAAGVKLPARAVGTAAAGNHMPVLAGQEQGGTYTLIKQAAEGETIAGDETPVLPCKDSTGKWAHIPLNGDGEVIVSLEGGGSRKRNHATIVGVIGSFVELASITLAATTDYEAPMIVVSASHPTLWELVSVDDYGVTDVTTVLSSFLTGAGQYSLCCKLENFEFSSAATGVQNLHIRGKQLRGDVTDLHSTLTVIEKA